ncbi:MAG: carbohydrate-binding domain-containing protein [Draconibacterium sp.]
MKPYFRLLLLLFTLNAVFSCNTVVNNGEDDEEDDDENEIENITGTEDESDYVFSTDGATQITLNGSSATIAGSGATTEGSKVTITANGIYVITGTLTSGQLVVKTDDTDAVKLVLNGMSITNTTTSPLFVDKAVKVILILNDNTNNVFTDGANYSDLDEGQNAAIFSQSYLSVFGNGTLTVTGKYKDGISGKDGLVIKSGNINVTAADDAIRGKDYLHIYDAKITTVSSGDGLLSDNETSASVGIVRIENGTFNITASGDGISAASSLTTLNGNFKITSGGGSSKTVSSTLSAKALKAAGAVTLAGTFDLSAAEDAIHSDTDVTINSGSFTISAADDGIHATANIIINSGDVSITKSEEGIEAKFITYNSGNIEVISNDDCSNSTNGMRTEANDGSHSYINGGTLILSSANGDPLDSNGNITMKGGTVIIHGPKQQPEVPIDYNGTFNLNNGFLIAAGIASNMTQAPSSSSAQKSVRLFFNSSLTAGTLCNIQDDSGNTLVTFKPERNYSAIIFSSAEITSGKTLKIYTGGTATGTTSNGLYTDGTYSGGNLRKSISISNTITSVTGL